ncbi:MAG: hypothetical protein AAFR58_25530 [Cyanobacteria bacterium J06627_28]
MNFSPADEVLTAVEVWSKPSDFRLAGVRLAGVRLAGVRLAGVQLADVRFGLTKADW